MKVTCSHCHGKYDVDYQYAGQQIKCPICENNIDVINENLEPCPDCYSLISKRALTCPKCGAPLRQQTYAPSEASSTNASRTDISSEVSIAVYHPSALNYFWGIILGLITIPVFLIGVFMWCFIL